jgi:hypothetical protein
VGMRIFVAVLSTIGVNQHGRIFAVNIRKAIAKRDVCFCFKWISSALWVDFPKLGVGLQEIRSG